MKQAFVFIYAKDKKIKVLSFEESKRLHNKLLKEGWKHTSTLDACMWIQFLYNNCENLDLLDEVKSLCEAKSLYDGT
jgi:hypothetical protein